jgi:hypothetical protein
MGETHMRIDWYELTRTVRLDRRNGRRALVAAIVALAVVGCGGGGSGSANAIRTTSAAKHTIVGAAADTGTVTFNVTDEIGEPAPNVELTVYLGPNSLTTRTDENGRATFRGFAPGNVHAFAYFSDASGFHRVTADAVRPANGDLDLAVAMTPVNAHPSFGVAPSVVAPGAVAADGRSVEFTLRIIYVFTEGYDYDSPPFHMLLANCTPDVTNDEPLYRADCVKGPAGYDAPYAVVDPLDPEVVDMPGDAPAPFSAVVLMDQSRNIIPRDAPDARLFGVKYFLHAKGEDNRAALAAFAANDTKSGERRLLPQEPITTFPGGTPEFTSSTRDLYPSIDSLAGLEGGAAPLSAAIDTMLDLIAVNPTATGHKAIVVVTAGLDDTCGAPAECWDAQQASIEKSRAESVAIVAVGIASPAQRELTELTEASGGAALWVDDQEQLKVAMGEVGAAIDGSIQTKAAHFRIESPVDGAFQSGRTVFGTVNFQVCGWGCSDNYIPVAVRIP